MIPTVELLDSAARYDNEAGVGRAVADSAFRASLGGDPDTHVEL